MKIAYIVNHLEQTGLNNVVLDLITKMQEHGHTCDLYYLKDVQNAMSFPCEVKKLDRSSKTTLTSYDIVHTHGLRPDAFVFLHRPFKTKTKFIATIHCYVFQDFCDLFGKVKGFLLGLIFLLTLLRHDKIVTLSKDAMKYYSRWLPKHKLTYAYNTRILEKEDLSEEERNEILAFKQDSVLIGMNCVLILRKGIDVMLKALALLPNNYKLFIAGSGKEAQTFQDMAKQLGMEERVFFAGTKHKAYRYLPYYDIYALPSRSEGFPLSLLEAADYGKKVVCSSLPIVKECFTDDELKIFDMPNEHALAETIKEITNNQQIGNCLKQKFDECYSPECFYQRYLEIYENVLK